MKEERKELYIDLLSKKYAIEVQKSFLESVLSYNEYFKFNRMLTKYYLNNLISILLFSIIYAGTTLKIPVKITKADHKPAPLHTML